MAHTRGEQNSGAATPFGECMLGATLRLPPPLHTHGTEPKAQPKAVLAGGWGLPWSHQSGLAVQSLQPAECTAWQWASHKKAEHATPQSGDWCVMHHTWVLDIVCSLCTPIHEALGPDLALSRRDEPTARPSADAGSISADFFFIWWGIPRQHEPAELPGSVAATDVLGPRRRRWTRRPQHAASGLPAAKLLPGARGRQHLMYLWRRCCMVGLPRNGGRCSPTSLLVCMG